MRKFIITRNILTQWHNEFNEEYFGGKLSMPSFIIKTNTSRQLGCFKGGTNTISISIYYDRSEFEFKNTFIHEMIHQWQWETYRDVNHGYTFKTMAERINRMGGWKIQRCSETTHDVAEGIAVRKRRTTDTEKMYAIVSWERFGQFCYCACSLENEGRFMHEAIRRGYDCVNTFRIRLARIRECRISINTKDLRYYTDKKCFEKLVGVPAI